MGVPEGLGMLSVAIYELGDSAQAQSNRGNQLIVVTDRAVRARAFEQPNPIHDRFADYALRFKFA